MAVAAAVLRTLAIVLAIYLVCGALAWWFAERLIFRPQPAVHSRGEDLMIPVVDGDSIAARWLLHPGASHVILLSHGNAEDLGSLGSFLERLSSEGFSVLAYDYRGYGHSTGRSPTEHRAYQDHEAAYRHLTGDLGVSPSRIIIHGRSLGGGVASELAARCPAAGLILESTFTSAFRVVAPPLFPFDRFATLPRLGKISMPVLVVHGTEDSVVPITHGRALFAAAPPGAAALWVDGAGHDDVALVAGDQYFSALREFAASLPPAKARHSC